MQKEYDIIVVGAGPAGTTAARFAAEQGVSVLVLEKDRDVGYPVRCGEAASKDGIEQFIEPNPKWIASTISSFILVAPDETEVKLNFDRRGYVLERRIFDYELAKIASRSGAEIITKAYVHDLLRNGDGICGVKIEHEGEKKEIKSKIVIAADGVESRIGRFAGINTTTHFSDMECCVQYTVSNINLENSSCYFYFGSKYPPGGYLWIFPKGNNSVNIGLGIGGNQAKKRSPLSYLNEFIETKYPNISRLTVVSGGVPCSVTLKEIVKQNVMLCGDAAHQVNPLSGGGIVSGMIGGSICGRIAGEAIKKNNLTHLKNYPKEWHQRVGKKHEMYYRVKTGIYKFTDEKLNSIAHSAIKIPDEKRTLGGIFKIALFDQPGLLIDIAKLFIPDLSLENKRL
ncbi:MAG: NAD(P)/FAD-dependent oxidoreductase [Bacteroidetes bacterium]|nr:NAD(P)/FAD-dependent oxidoreductase [Bacteroidota bacterium]MBU2586473.1 NAD(P)/FAD-dependent oxidoreductase [Bacteroidota bacterium]